MHKTLTVRTHNTPAQNFRNLGLAVLTGAAMLAPSSVMAVGIGDDLQAAATTAITAVLAIVAVILVAAFALPVGRKTYKLVKGAITGA